MVPNNVHRPLSVGSLGLERNADTGDNSSVPMVCFSHVLRTSMQDKSQKYIYNIFRVKKNNLMHFLSNS